MPRVVATIQLKRTDEGGRKTPLSVSSYRATVFFEDLPQLGGHGYDCRFARLGDDGAEWVAPGETVVEVAVSFLSGIEVLPHMQPGVRFALWEAGAVGTGTVVRIERGDDE